MDTESDPDDQTRESVRDDLSRMSFEELLRLKEQLGSKIYNERVLKAPSKKKQTDFKRANKNRPREMSSKIKAPPIGNIDGRRQQPRDPRFDPLCGTFNERAFKSSYRFVEEIKKNEREILAKRLKRTDDAKEVKKIKYLIQRMDNQTREREKREKKEAEMREEAEERRKKLMRGERPQYVKKSQKRIENLLNKYEELKQSNKLRKHIAKRSKKLAHKEYKNK